MRTQGRKRKMEPSRLQAELKQNKPFALLETEVSLNLLRTQGVLRGPADALLRASGLSASGYNVLRILRGAGTTGLPCRDIGDRMVTRVPDVTRLLDRLTTDGLVSRERARDDRRVVLTQITSEGRRLVDSLDEPVETLAKESLGHMSQHELRTLSRLLEKARNPAR